MCRQCGARGRRARRPRAGALAAAEPILSRSPGDVEHERDPSPSRRADVTRSAARACSTSRAGGASAAWTTTNLPALRLAEIVLAHGSGRGSTSSSARGAGSPIGVSTVLIPYRDSGFLAAVTACDPHHAEQAESALVSEVERLASRGPTFPELEAARRQLHGSLARAYEVSRRLAGWQRPSSCSTASSPSTISSAGSQRASRPTSRGPPPRWSAREAPTRSHRSGAFLAQATPAQRRSAASRVSRRRWARGAAAGATPDGTCSTSAPSAANPNRS